MFDGKNNYKLHWPEIEIANEMVTSSYPLWYDHKISDNYYYIFKCVLICLALQLLGMFSLLFHKNWNCDNNNGRYRL